MRLSRPQTIDEALRLAEESTADTKIIAGGTALMLMMRHGLLFPDHLIALERIPGLAYVDASDEVIRIGALAPLRRLQRTPELADAVPTLAETLGLVANHRVRGRATIGGNLAEADYASDPPAVLTTLGCRVRLRSVDSERVLSLPEFLVGFYETALRHSEILTEILLPRPAPTARTVYLKYVSRSAEDRPCVGVAAYLDVDTAGRCRDLRIAVAAATATPFTLPDVTTACQGDVAGEELWNEVAAEFSSAIAPISDGRGSAEYRKQVTGELVRRALRMAWGEGANGAMRL